MDHNELIELLDETFKAVAEQLESDAQRWGNTWKKRPREGQEERTFARFRDYLDQYRNAGVPIPWLKIIGEAHICLVRELHPELAVGQPKE